jgi:hypothetical protein
MALIDLNALLTELNAAEAIEITNLKGYDDILSFNSLSTQSRAIINAAQIEAQSRSTHLHEAISAINDLILTGYPARTYPAIDAASLTTINAEIDAEVSGIHKVMKKLGSLV